MNQDDMGIPNLRTHSDCASEERRMTTVTDYRLIGEI